MLYPAELRGRSAAPRAWHRAAMWFWWSGRGSNPRPSHCERDALPTELPPHARAAILALQSSMTNFGFDLTGAWFDGYDRHSSRRSAVHMLDVGSRAPEFTLPDHDGRDTSLSMLLKRGPLILYFYPADFTRGCTRQACAIRALHDQIVRVGFTVAGVSPQPSARHLAFRQRYELPFTLLSDPSKSVIMMYGVDGPFGFGVRRATFLIDQARYIRGAVLADFRIGEHAAFIQRTLAMSAR